MAVSTAGASPADGDLGAAREALAAQERAAREAEAAAKARAVNATRPGFLELVKSLLGDLPGLVSDRVHLLALELKRARQALLQMAALVILAAILAATAWVALWALVVALLLSAGLALPLALLIVLLVNAGGSWLALRRVGALADLLTLPATLRHLTLSPAPPPDASGAKPAQSENTSRGTP